MWKPNPYLWTPNPYQLEARKNCAKQARNRLESWLFTLVLMVFSAALAGVAFAVAHPNWRETLVTFLGPEVVIVFFVTVALATITLKLVQAMRPASLEQVLRMKEMAHRRPDLVPYLDGIFAVSPHPTVAQFKYYLAHSSEWVEKERVLLEGIEFRASLDNTGA